MLQIAIWGIAAMLVVKAIDILHQQSISKSAGNPGSEELSTTAALISIGAAIGLVWLAQAQVSSSDLTANRYSGGTYDGSAYPVRNAAMSVENSGLMAADASAAASNAAAEALGKL